MIISLFMERAPLSGGGGARLPESAHDRHDGQQARELRSHEGEEQERHRHITAKKSVQPAVSW
jgi:hypothetical protein